jgi:CRISPR system Cascade subunit CasD
MPTTLPDFLVFQIYGNLASWGDIAVGEHRPVQAYPSKSAITGLLAAALGLKRDNDQPHIDLNNHYGIAVCVQAQGELMRDYHTTQVPSGNKGWYSRKDELTFSPLDLKTILSQRDYQMDAYYLVSVWLKDAQDGKAPYTLERLAEALQQPVFTTCLGRKSCPPCLPYNPKIIKELPLKQACESYEIADDFKPANRKDDLITWYWETGLELEQSGLKHSMTYTRRDQIRSRKRWQFSKREELYFAEPRQGDA